MRDWTENQVTLAVIRHGATQANKECRYLGKTDESLSKSGIEALLSYQKQNIYPDVDYLFTSPMKRCIETAGILYPKLCQMIIPEWKEMDFGQFEYKNYEELKDDARYQAWIDSGGAQDFPDGEGRDRFILRCKAGLYKMCDALSRVAGQEDSVPLRVGVVVHGGTVMALLGSYSKKSYFDYQVSNGRGYLCRMENWYRKTISEKDALWIEVIREI